VLAVRAATGYETWTELFSFVRRRTAGEYLPGVPSARAYVFLTVAGDRVLVNPFNTARHHGTVLTTTPGERHSGGPDCRQCDDATVVR
jgi:hypothetical protein